MLTGKKLPQVQRSLILSGFISLPIAAGFLFIGIALYAYYQIYPDPALPQIWFNGAEIINAEQVFPHFIRNELPVGLKGLVLIGIIAVAMSSLDSAIGALSATVTLDIYKPFFCKAASDKHYLLMSRVFVLLFAVLLPTIAYLFRYSQGFLWLVNKTVGVGYGALLGVFLVGLLTRRGIEYGNLFAMIMGYLIAAILLVLIETNTIALAWSWVVIIGTCCTFGIAICWRGTQDRVAY